jgi:DNA-binding protein HU-beta
LGEADGMKKADLIGEIAKSANISKREAQKVVDAAVSSVKGALEKGDRVTLAGFGTFYVGKRAARAGRNPSTGAVIEVKASKVPKFRAGSVFRAVVSMTGSLPGKPTTLPRKPKKR